MPLVTCPDCHATMSDRAPSCPHCGCPNGNLPPAEQTAKIYKLQQLLAGILCFIGLAVYFFAMLAGSGGALALAGVVFALGLGWLIVVHLLVWWHHR